MKELYELRDMLEKELKEYGSKGELSAGSLQTIDTLSHTLKNLDKIIECDENGGYSEWYPYGYEDGWHNGSYARGRTGNVRRDTIGRYSRTGYSRHGDIEDELRRLMNDAPNEQVRKDIQRLVDKIESM